MFVPLHDDTPLRMIRFQFVTGAIIVVNIVVFLMTGAFTSEVQLAMTAVSYGIVPEELLHGTGMLYGPGQLPEVLTLITYQFLHAGWMHLIGNLLFLWVFADNVEDAFGPLGFLIFYLLCGVAGGLAHSLVNPGSPIPLVGASGAVSGVLAAYLVLYPRARVWILLFLRIPLRIPAMYALGGWFAFQIFSAVVAGEEDVAFWAHIGGFVAGLVLTLALRSRLYLAKP